MSNDRDFIERLTLGQNYEMRLKDILNDHGVPAKLNNEDNVYDIDLELYDDNMYVDSKFVKTAYTNSFKEYGILPENCMLINVNHVEKYHEKEKSTGKTVWIAFFVKYDDYKVKDLVFVPNSYLMYLINKARESKLNIIRDGKFRVNRTYCRSLDEFLNYIDQVREIKNMK